MSAGKKAGTTTETIDWYVEPDLHAPGATVADHSRARREEKRTNSVGIAVTTSLLVALLATAILVGGHAAIVPLLHRAAAARDAAGTGDVVYTMPDGVFCRHMSFNNATAEVTEGAIEPCPDPIGSGRHASATRFEWGGR